MCFMFQTTLLMLANVLVPLQEAPPTGSSPIDPVPSGNFPGGSLIRELVNYALYAGYAACLIGFIAGAGSLWLANTGRMGGSAHQYGVRALIGAVVGSMLLASITAFI